MLTVEERSLMDVEESQELDDGGRRVLNLIPLGSHGGGRPKSGRLRSLQLQ